MKDLLEKLEDNINQELEVQLSVQELLDQQLDIFRSGQTTKLTAVLEAAEAGLKESAELDAERMQLLAQVGTKLGVSARVVTLQMIEDELGSAASPLREKADELKAILVRIRESNRKVSLLVRHSVLFIEDVVRVLTGRKPPLAVYNEDGAVAYEEAESASG